MAAMPTMIKRVPLTTKSDCRSRIASVVLGLLTIGCSGLQHAPDERDQWRARALEGEARAQYQLAKSYCCGLGARRSTRKALYWYCRAAVQGDVTAQYEMGNVLSGFFNDSSRSNTFYAPDYTSAYMWYTVASIHGHQQALDVREQLATKMSVDEVAQGKRWATKWKQIHCDNLR